jgi:hypothetical protein
MPRFFWLVTVLFAWVPVSSAQQHAPVQVDPQAVAVVNQSLVAMGIGSYVQGIPQTTAGVAIQDSLATGTVFLWDGTSGTITTKTKGLGLLRTDININGNQTTTVSNSGSGYVIQGGTKSSLPVWLTKYRRAGHVPVFSRMADYAQPTTNITYVGLEAVNGASVHHIRISSIPTDGTPANVESLISEFHVFVDATSLLPVKTLSFDLSPLAIQNRVPIETYYTNYQSVNGVLVPFHITRYFRGQTQMDIVLTGVQFNVGLPNTDFQ